MIAVLTGTAFASSLSTGLLTIGLPRIAADVELPEHLLLWPSSVFALTCGSVLLLAGSVADVLGSRHITMAGCFLLGCFIIACGLAKNGIELIIFRALQGIALSFLLPTSVSILVKGIASGRGRNIGLSCVGLGQPLGYSLGLVLGGVFVDTIGWRFGFYMCGALAIALFLVSIWALPVDNPTEGEAPLMNRLVRDIDWIGAAIASSCLGIFSYVLA